MCPVHVGEVFLFPERVVYHSLNSLSTSYQTDERLLKYLEYLRHCTASALCPYLKFTRKKGS